MAIDVVKWLVSSVLGSFLLVHQNGYWFSVILGGLVNALAVKILKRIINLPRPTREKSDPGMPSSHAHSLSYFTFFALFTQSRIEIVACTGLLTLWVCRQRVKRRIHTFNQCAVGVFTGLLGSYAWVIFFHEDLCIWVDHQLNITPVNRYGAVASSILIGIALIGGVGKKISGNHS